MRHLNHCRVRMLESLTTVGDVVEKTSVGADESGNAAVRVYGWLREAIVDGTIPPGTKINIDQVARDVGVSQTPVREALQKLEGDGLLDYRPGRGYTTTPVLDIEGLNALFEFRFLIEPWAARVVASDRMTNPADELDAELERFARRISENGDLRQVVLAHDSVFHALILSATGNPVVGQAFAQSHVHLHLFRLFSVDTDGSIAMEEHAKISDAIRRCDADGAEIAMREHIRGSYGRSARVFGDALPGDIARASEFVPFTRRTIVD